MKLLPNTKTILHFILLYQVAHADPQGICQNLAASILAGQPLDNPHQSMTTSVQIDFLWPSFMFLYGQVLFQKFKDSLKIITENVFVLLTKAELPNFLVWWLLNTYNFTHLHWVKIMLNLFNINANHSKLCTLSLGFWDIE